MERRGEDGVKGVDYSHSIGSDPPLQSSHYVTTPTAPRSRGTQALTCLKSSFGAPCLPP